MNSSARSKVFPKSRHFGFKRPVFFEPAKDDDEKEGEKNDENKEKTEADKKSENPEPKKMDIQLLSFSISTELLTLQESSSSAPGFDWIHESESKEKIFNESNFAFEESDITKDINDNIDTNPMI